MAAFFLLPLFYIVRSCLAARTVPSEIAIAVVTSSPVHSSRLPALSWLVDARARCASVLVVSDVRDHRYGTIACPCSASHWGIPCKSACAFTALREAVRTAKWYVRVMDDTLVDVDSLAWHLSALGDVEKPLYVGEMIQVMPFGFEAALGGAGWALNRRALDLASDHVELYHTLTWTMGCNYTETGQLCVGPAWPLPEEHRGRLIVPAGRGLKLQSPFADDIMWGTFMAALNISSAGPAGFTQAPVDIFDGIPFCRDESYDSDNARRSKATMPEEELCGRIHSLGVVYSDELVSSIGQAYGIGSCRRDDRARPAVIHLGDEVGSMPSRVWRNQFPALESALSSSDEALVATYNSAPYHYWSLCTKNISRVRDRIPPPQTNKRPDPLELKVTIDSSERLLAVDVCDDPETRAKTFCREAGADTTQCAMSVKALVAQAKDVLARHHRRARQQIYLGDGSLVNVSIAVGESPSHVSASFCRIWSIAPGDCAELRRVLTSLLPVHAQGWCE